MTGSDGGADAGSGGAIGTQEVAAVHLRAAIGLLADNKTKEALLAASKACHAAPERAAAHYVYGQAWSALGDEDKAEQAFATAIKLKPDWADAWVNYGIARYRRGAIADAKTAMRQALRHVPDHPAATANLGAFMRISGEAEGAEALLDAAVARDPHAIGARLNRAADLLQEERAAEALDLLGAASPADPASGRHWYLQRSLALLQLSRRDEARAALDAFDALGPTPPALAPLRLWRSVLLAQAEGDAAGADVAAQAMEAALDAMGPAAVPEHRIMGHYELAKFRSGRNEHSHAFAHWQAAHALLAPMQPFSRAAHSVFIEDTIASFPAARFTDGPRANNRDAAPVFIVGMPRSGTTLCEQILAAHRDVHGAGERGALERVFAVLGGGREGPIDPACVADVDVTVLDEAAGTYLAELHALAPSATRIVDKMPGNALYLGLVGLMLPSAKIIHCRRDPRDIGLSIFTFRFHGDHGYAHDLGDLGWTIRQRERLMDHWKAALPNGVLTVDLADWVNDFDGTLARVLAHLDLPPDPNCAHFHEQESRVRTVSRAQVRQPVNARGLGRWRAYADELAPLIAELGPTALVTRAAARRSRDRTGLSILQVDDPARAMGLAVQYLMMKPAFARQSFGDWAQILVGQIERGHYRIVIDAAGRVRGFFGWALTSEAAAEDWVMDRRPLRSAECRGGDRGIFNVWSAETLGVVRFMIDVGRPIMEKTKMLYFKRYYDDGRIRPVRLATTDFLRGHIDRAVARDGAGGVIGRGVETTTREL